MVKYLAHITRLEGKRAEQTVTEHLLQVARYAAEKLEGIGLSHTAYLAGLLHDMGKYTAAYQEYLEKAARGEDVARGTVNHTFCGCKYLFEHYHTGKNQGFDTITCEIIAFAIGSHHGEFDCVTLEQTSGFEKRILKDPKEISYDSAVAEFLSQCAPQAEIDSLFALAQAEIAALLPSLRMLFGNGRKTIKFLTGMAARMVLSAVIDGDRRDTAEFMNGIVLNRQIGSQQLWAEQLEYLEQKISSFDTTAPINRARSEFSEQCRSFAQTHSGGIYRLTLPTGGGKTLASLRYALAHGQRFAKKRIVFVIPLLTILEQNSKVLRDFIKDEAILTEHHSNVVKTFETEEKLDEYEWLCETWESPMIITTLVQLLNTLFSHKTTAIRRMSALADSVIVIDEIQSLPKKTTNLFTMAINFLAYGCGATVVLSSATQPCFDQTAKPLKYSVPADMVPYQKELFDVFKRTNIIDKTTTYGLTIEELADLCEETAEDISSLLVICNTKESALRLYRCLKQRAGEFQLFHLSAAMCMQHRSDILGRIHTCLKNKEKIICISTQLVEAGVDFSFEGVIRVVAGIDNAAQAAGRCNRHNDFGGLRLVILVNLKPGEENLRMLREIEVAQRCTKNLLQHFTANPQQYDNDLLSEKSIAEYYSLLFQENDIKDQFGFPVKCNGRTLRLFDLLAENIGNLERPEFKGKYFLNQSFLTAGQLFQVLDENTTEVIVPYNEEAKELINNLFSQKSNYQYSYLKEQVEKAKPYTIHIYEYQKRQLDEWKMLSSSEEQKRFIALDPQCYHPETGLTMENFIF